MHQFDHMLITTDHFLQLNVDGELNHLLEDESCRGPEEELLKLMVKIRDNMDFKMLADNHVICCHSMPGDCYVSFRLVLRYNDLLACKFCGFRDIEYPVTIEYPYGRVGFGLDGNSGGRKQSFLFGDEYKIANSVEIARAYPDRIMCKPSFALRHYTVEPECVKYGYDRPNEVYYGNFSIETTYSQKSEDFSSLNSIISSGVDAYMSRQHTALINTLKQLRAETVETALQPDKNGKLNSQRVVRCYNAFFKNRKSSFFGNSATRFRVGKASIYVFRAFGVHHIHVAGIPGTVVALDNPPCTSGECKPDMIDQMRRYADFVQFSDSIQYANNAVRDFIFDAYVIHGIPVITEGHIFDIAYSGTDGYLRYSATKCVLTRDSEKKYLWWLKWNGKTVKVGLDVGKKPHFFGFGWNFTSPLKETLENIRHAKYDAEEQQQ